MGTKLKLEADKWPGTKPVDPYVRLAVALAETETTKNVASLLGMDEGVLEVLAELLPKDDPKLFEELKVPQAFDKLKKRHVTGTIALQDLTSLRERVADLHARVKRLKLSSRHQPRLQQSLRDMGPGDPPWKSVGGSELYGKDVIVGIIDDGCAFAHRNFLKPGNGTPFQSRILYLWDQHDRKNTSGKWTTPADFEYGQVLSKAEIDDVLKSQVNPDTRAIREDAIYEALDYRAIEFGAHGTHVMDIAAGNGSAAAASPGVAPGADIIFVQIPKTAIGNPADSVLASYLLDGCAYIFARAQELNKPAVINISYGGYGGPHDGTSLLERAIDELLEEENRAVVVAAGNGLVEDCHASGNVDKSRPSALAWLIGAEDPTLNLMEIWYGKDAALSVSLTPPNAPALHGIALGHACSLQRVDDGVIVGWIFHRKSDSGNGDNHVLIALRPTKTPPAGQVTNPKVAPAPAGTWKIELHNPGDKAVEFHAWIERDDAGSRTAAAILQSRFSAGSNSGSSATRCTLGSLATGELAISVGAYNTATQEVCRYSASGPTRNNRPKPDVCAPAEEDETEQGILSAAALSGQPTRMNGTSAAAPHVAGLIALMFEAARLQGKTLTAKKIRELITANAENKLKPNGRWRNGSVVLRYCAGAGKVNAAKTVKAV